jgi:uncharacterized protein YgiM (DUF1202 family)
MVSLFHLVGAGRRSVIRASLAAVVAVMASAAQAPVRAQSGPNLLDNPDFGWPEQKNPDVCATGWIKDNAVTPRGWTAYWACKSGDQTNQDQINREPEFRPMNADVAEQRPRVRSYPTSASFFNFYSLNKSAGLVQVVRNVTPGSRLRFSIWTQMWTTNGDEATSVTPGGLQARACIDTSGATLAQPNFSSSSIVCGQPTRDYDKFVQISVEATAASNQVTVIFDTSADYPVKHNDVFADDAELVVIGGASSPAASAQQAPAAPAAPEPGAPAPGAPAVTIKLTTANVRAAPNFTAQILASEPQGATYAALAVTQDREWFQIQYKGGTAYIHNSVVTPNAAATAALGGAPSSAVGVAPGVAPPAAPAPTTAPAPAAPAPSGSIDALPVLPAAPQQPAAPAPTAAPATTAPAPAAPATAKNAPAGASVTANTGRNRLLVRAQPTTTGAIVGRVPNGTAFKVLGISADRRYWRVAYAGGPAGEAWVMVQWTTANATAQALLK